MSTYTVLQDIEAEDKLLGPLTLRQFIYASICIGSLFIAYTASKVTLLLALPFLLPAFVFGFLAAPWGKDQPTETWAVAKVRFFFKPRKRIWDQSGQKEVVEITVPKHIAVQYTNGLSQHEVRSRLQTLASTIDSRGWAIKNSTYGVPAQPVVFSSAADSDRLTGAPSLPQAVPEYANELLYDVLDEQHSPVSQQINQMITASESAHRQQIIDRMNAPVPTAAAPAPQTMTQQPWFTGQQQGQSLAPAQAKDPSANEMALLQNLQKQEELEKHLSKSHLRTIQPLGAEPVQSPPSLQTPLVQIPTIPTNDAALVTPEESNIRSENDTDSATIQQSVHNAEKTAMTPAPDPGILELSRNDDLDVATIARQVRRKPQDEVVISLH